MTTEPENLMSIKSIKVIYFFFTIRYKLCLCFSFCFRSFVARLAVAHHHHTLELIDWLLNGIFIVVLRIHIYFICLCFVSSIWLAFISMDGYSHQIYIFLCNISFPTSAFIEFQWHKISCITFKFIVCVCIFFKTK